MQYTKSRQRDFRQPNKFEQLEDLLLNVYNIVNWGGGVMLNIINNSNSTSLGAMLRAGVKLPFIFIVVFPFSFVS